MVCYKERGSRSETDTFKKVEDTVAAQCRILYVGFRRNCLLRLTTPLSEREKMLFQKYSYVVNNLHSQQQVSDFLPRKDLIPFTAKNVNLHYGFSFALLEIANAFPGNCFTYERKAVLKASVLTGCLH